MECFPVMVDIALSWAVMVEAQLKVSRDEVRAWCTELHLPLVALAGSSQMGLFKNLASAVSLEYPDGSRTISLRKTGTDSADTLVRDLLSSSNTHIEDVPVRLAQLKFRNTRRNVQGDIPGSHSMTLRVRRDLDPAEEALARQWLDKFCVAFDTYEDIAPLDGVRKIVRASFDAIGVPVRRRSWMHYVYRDGWAGLEDIGEFLRRLGNGAELFVAVLRDSAVERALMASAVEEHLVLRLVKVELGLSTADMSASGASGRVGVFRRLLDEITELIPHHEQRLGVTLTDTRRLLTSCEEKIATLKANKNLRSVTLR